MKIDNIGDVWEIDPSIPYAERPVWVNDLFDNYTLGWSAIDDIPHLSVCADDKYPPGVYSVKSFLVRQPLQVIDEWELI